MALLLGAVVLLAHSVTMREMIELPAWWQIDWPDIAKHGTLIASFALAYRLSFPLAARAADWPSVALCSSWAGLCELVQHYIPARDFSMFELAANVLTPLVVVWLIRALAGWRSWFQ